MVLFACSVLKKKNAKKWGEQLMRGLTHGGAASERTAQYPRKNPRAPLPAHARSICPFFQLFNYLKYVQY
jgi:hypothetical protein